MYWTHIWDNKDNNLWFIENPFIADHIAKQVFDGYFIGTSDRRFGLKWIDWLKVIKEVVNTWLNCESDSLKHKLVIWRILGLSLTSFCIFSLWSMLSMLSKASTFSFDDFRLSDSCLLSIDEEVISMSNSHRSLDLNSGPNGCSIVGRLSLTAVHKRVIVWQVIRMLSNQWLTVWCLHAFQCFVFDYKFHWYNFFYLWFF